MQQPDEVIRLSVLSIDLRSGVRLRTGARFQISIVPAGTIFARITDARESKPLADRSYRILDVLGADIEGTTDSDGLLRHEAIPVGYYALSMDNEETTVFADIEPSTPASVRMLTISPSDE